MLDSVYAPPLPRLRRAHRRHYGLRTRPAPPPAGEHCDEPRRRRHRPRPLRRFVRARRPRALFRTLQVLADVILVGATTVRIEGYGPVQPTDEERALRRAARRPEVPPIAVVTGRLNLDLTGRFFVNAEVRPLLLTTKRAPEQARVTASAVADVLVLCHDRVDLRSALDALADRGLKHVLCEGGPNLLSQLVAADLLDEICLTTAPLLIGGAVRQIAKKPLHGVARCTLSQLCEDHDYLFARYRVGSPI